MPQTWIVHYPLLAYKNFNPNNKEICIVHLAQDSMPQRVINLGDWEFVCFVNHTLMCEKKVFQEENETNSDIMFLAERNGKMRLMSFKSNPWLNSEDEDDHGFDEVNDSIYLFSGILGQ